MLYCKLYLKPKYYSDYRSVIEIFKKKNVKNSNQRQILPKQTG